VKAGDWSETPFVLKELPNCELLPFYSVGSISEPLFAVNDSKIGGYQPHGFNQMVSLHHSGFNGIFSPTRPYVSPVFHLILTNHSPAPRQNPLNDSLHLILEAPPCTQPNRHSKINPPKLGARVQTVDSRCERCRSKGTKEERADIIVNRLIRQDVEVCITCYEHIKKVDSIRSEIVCSFISHKKTIHAVEPQIFVDYAYCNSFLRNEIVEALHKILRLFLLMRVKSDVEKNLLPSMCSSFIILWIVADWCYVSYREDVNISVGLMDMQWKWHRSVLENNIDAVNGKPQ
jgi:SWI/SNF-related matrix-associated actin-dependent regulator of chromatin subfamily A member 5